MLTPNRRAQIELGTLLATWKDLSATCNQSEIEEAMRATARGVRLTETGTHRPKAADGPFAGHYYDTPLDPTIFFGYQPSDKQRSFLDLSCEEALFGGAIGGGKGLPPDAGVLTPWGFRPIGKLKVGSKICATDGSVTEVIAVYHRGVQPRYEITWHDGTKTICDEDHIWFGWRAGRKRKHRNVPQHGRSSARKWTTKELFDNFGDDLTSSGRFSIPPISRPVAYNVHGENHGPYKHISRKIPPYVLGTLLGDGCLSNSACLYSADDEVAEHVSAEMCVAIKPFASTVKKKCKAYPIRGINGHLKDLGLDGKRSWEKSIPRIYRLGGIDDRWALLQGLMDTDGWCEEDGNCYFTSSSKQLRDDVAEVARSLGAIVTLRKGRKYFRCSRTGERKQGRIAYTARIAITNPQRLFRLERKRRKATEPQSLALRMTRIRKIDEGPTVCISIAHPNSLFITDNFVVTHNSQALLMAAGQYVHVPGYHAILFRRTRPNLQDLVDRARLVYGDWAKWTGDIRGGRLTFPSGAIIDFGYMQLETDKFNYKGPEYQAILFDELTEFSETQYTFLFTRLRRSTCAKHGDTYTSDCEVCQQTYHQRYLPLRVRGATNPDGPGRLWVCNRLVSDEAQEDIEQGLVKEAYPKDNAVFVPSFVQDNPGIDADEYIERTCARLTQKQAHQLFRGSWKAIEGAVFDEATFRYYTHDEIGRRVLLSVDGNRVTEENLSEWTKIVTIDTAHTSEEKAREKRGKPHSYSVAASWSMIDRPWSQDRSGISALSLDRVVRGRWGWLELRASILEFLSEECPTEVIIEDTTGSRSLIEECRRAGYNVTAFNPSQKYFKGAKGVSGKLERSHGLQTLFEKGKVYFPLDDRQSEWFRAYTGELLAWEGHEDETADQIDVSSMAAIKFLKGGIVSANRYESEVVGSGAHRPQPSPGLRWGQDARGFRW